MTPSQVETLRRLRKQRIRFLVVGGQAMRALGIDRPTRDLDVWVARDPANARALAQLVRSLGQEMDIARLEAPNLKLTIGDPARPDVDILNSVAGNPLFDECYARAERLMLDGRRILVIAVADLISIKRASAQVMDTDAANPQLGDVERRAAELTGAKERRDVDMLVHALGLVG